MQNTRATDLQACDKLKKKNQILRWINTQALVQSNHVPTSQGFPNWTNKTIRKRPKPPRTVYIRQINRHTHHHNPRPHQSCEKMEGEIYNGSQWNSLCELRINNSRTLHLTELHNEHIVWLCTEIPKSGFCSGSPRMRIGQQLDCKLSQEPAELRSETMKWNEKCPQKTNVICVCTISVLWLVSTNLCKPNTATTKLLPSSARASAATTHWNYPCITLYSWHAQSLASLAAQNHTVKWTLSRFSTALVQ